MDPDHDWSLAVVKSRRPHVEIEAVFRHRLLTMAHDPRKGPGRRPRRLDGDRSELKGFANTVPGLHRLRPTPAQLADRRLSVRHSAKDVNAVLDLSSERSLTSLNRRRNRRHVTSPSRLFEPTRAGRTTRSRVRSRDLRAASSRPDRAPWCSAGRRGIGASQEAHSCSGCRRGRS